MYRPPPVDAPPRHRHAARSVMYPTDVRGTPRVLLVEDDADTREVMERLLARDGCEVRAAESVGRALVILGEWTPTHVLLDLMMPDAAGSLLLRALRRDCIS